MIERWNPRELPAYLAVGLLVAVTVVAYANAWPDVLVLDDKFFVGSPRLAEWADSARFFTEDLWAASGAESGLYRPLLLISLAFETQVFDDWLAGYHLDNIVLHLFVALVVYGFLRQVPRAAAQSGPSSDLFALLAALVFAVHPVHTEVVDSIFNRSEMLVALAGAGGLWWFLYFLQTRPGLSWSGLTLCYLFALFSKESGIVLPAIAVALVLIVVPGPSMPRLRKCLPVLWLFLPLIFYLILRTHTLAHPGPDGMESTPVTVQTSAETPIQSSSVTFIQIASPSFAYASTQPPDQVLVKATAQTSTPTPTKTLAVILDQSLAQASAMMGEARLLTFRTVSETIGVWGQSLWLMVWPDPLLLYRDKPSPTLQWVSLIFQLGLLATAFLQLRAKRYGLLAGLVFFYIAMLPSSRMMGIGGTSAELAERYLYFPSVGLTISLASGFSYLGHRWGRWFAVAAAIIALTLLMPLTWQRNSDWASEVRLLENEYLRGSRGPQTLRLLTAAYLRDGAPGEVAKICDTQSFEKPNLRKYAGHCAIAYARLGRNEDAERAFLHAASGRPADPVMHANLAKFYIRMRRREDALSQFALAVEAEDNPALRAYRRGEMLALIYPKSRRKLLEARHQFNEASRLQPQLAGVEEWLDRLNRKLGPSP